MSILIRAIHGNRCVRVWFQYDHAYQDVLIGRIGIEVDSAEAFAGDPPGRIKADPRKPAAA